MGRLKPPTDLLRSSVVRVALVVGLLAVFGSGALYVWTLVQRARNVAETIDQPYPRCAPPPVEPDGTVKAIVQAVRERAVSNETIWFDGWTPPQPLDLNNVRAWIVRFRVHEPDGPPGCEGDRVAIYTNNRVQIIVTPDELERYAREQGATVP